MNNRARVIAVFASLTVMNSAAEGLNSLREMQLYAQEMPEYPKSDNNNWLQPDFTTFYERYEPTWINTLLIKIGLRSRPLWQFSDFESLALNSMVSREQNGYSGRFVLHITPKPGDRFVLWGDIEGAYHSLVRDLIELKRRGIINDALEITQPNFYFVFSGDVINRSPYILETLTVVLQLMKKNPQRVFYVRGYGEDKENWYDLGTKDELKAKGGYFIKHTIPLNEELKRFFNTLPLALYLIGERSEDEVKVVRIASHAGSTDEINELFMGNFFDLPDTIHPALHKLFDRTQSTKKIVLAATIKSEDRSWRYAKTEGLTRLGFEDGAVTWSLLSSPTSTYRHLYEFFWDAFVFLRIRNKLDNWTLALYNQDVREELGFTKSVEYQLTSGFKVIKKAVIQPYQDRVTLLQERLKSLQLDVATHKKQCPARVPSDVQWGAKALPSEIAVQARKIVLGTTGDLKKGLKGYTHAMNAGSELVFNKVNEENGIHNKLIELVALNDNYDPAMARANVLHFLQDKQTDIIFNPLGSPTIVHYLDLIKAQKLLVLFPHTGSLEVRSPDLPYVINFQESYFQEARVLAEYALDHTSSRRYVILYQNDSYGIAPKEGAVALLKKRGVVDENIILVPYDRNNVNIEKHADQLQSFGPDAIFFFSTAPWAKSLIGHLGAAYFAGKTILAVSLLATKEFRLFMQNKGLPLVFAAQTPNPELSQLPLVQEFRELAVKHNVDIDASALEGYIAAELFAYLLSRIPKNQPISKAALVEAAQSIKNQMHKGLKLNYNRMTNSVNSTVWLATQEGKDWETVEVQSEGL